MDVHVVSTSRAVHAAFEALERGRTVTIYRHESDASLLPDLSETNAFLYIDISGMKTAGIRRKLGQLERALPFRYGVIDPKDQMVDPAEAFHRSASDYLNRALLKEGVTSARMKRVLDYCPHARGDRNQEEVPALELAAPASGSWSQVVRGEQYTFLMLYAGIDRVGDLRRKLSESFLGGVRKSFLSVVHHYLAPYGAKLWMWKEDDGLLLLPFDGESAPAIAAAVLMRLNWPVHQTENPREFGELSWRLGFHLGVTAYETGRQTGEIVSQDVNFVFHLGGRYVEPESIACTEPVFRLLAPRVQELFTPKGAYEEQPVFRSRRLL